MEGLKSWKGFLVLLAVLSLVFVPLAGKAVAAALELDDQVNPGSGGQVVFTLSVNNAPDDVSSLGVDISYCHTTLEYVEGSEDFAGGLLESFSFKDVSNPDPGVLRLGAFTAGAPLPAGASGFLVKLTFNVLDLSGCILQLSDLKDHIQGWSTKNGQLIPSPPTVSSVDPNRGPLAGGQTVTLTGTGFESGDTVTFGGRAATDVNVVSTTQLTCTTPAHEAGTVDVVVTDIFEQSGTLAGGYTFKAGPTVSSVDPNRGPLAGGQTVTLTGTGFESGDTVTFGGTAATEVNVVSATQLTCTTPAHEAGTVDVVVTDIFEQTGTLTVGYSYKAAPTVTSDDPNRGPAAGGQPVTLTGTGFESGDTVTFGGTAATEVNVVSATQLTCTTPAHEAGTVDVVVTDILGQPSNPVAYTYKAPPTVTGVDPDRGIAAGGQPVTLTGTGFESGDTVTFGGVAATDVNVVSATQITCTTPAHDRGTVDVTVTDIYGQSGTLADGYIFRAPFIANIAPDHGPLAGGQTVTLTGEDFADVDSVTFDGIPAINVTVVSDTQITCTTPAHEAGTVEVVATDTHGQSSPPENYDYITPNLTGIEPDRGPTSGGTPVTLTGSGLIDVDSVEFDGIPATDVTAVSDTEITCTTPEHEVGVVDVVATDTHEQSDTLEEAYEYVPFGIHPPSHTLRVGEIGTYTIVGEDVATPPFTWKVNGEVVQSGDSSTYDFSSAEAGTFTITVADSSLTPLTDDATANVYEDVVITPPDGFDPENPILESGDSFEFTFTGGERSSATWTVEGPESMPPFPPFQGLTYTFEAPTEGAFAGVYTITVTDDQTGWQHSVVVIVPLKFTPYSRNIRGGEAFEGLLAGADSGAELSSGILLDENGVEIPEDETDAYATVLPELPVPFDDHSHVVLTITGADVADLKMFKLRGTVTGDQELTDNGLAVVTTGWIRVMPMDDFSGIVQDIDTKDAISGALVLFVLGEEI